LEIKYTILLILFISHLKTPIFHQIGKTALHLAAEKGHEDTVRLLIEKGSDIKTKDAVSQTALQCTVLYVSALHFTGVHCT
jgi:Ankyrin repeats (3 copies)